MIFLISESATLHNSRKINVLLRDFPEGLLRVEQMFYHHIFTQSKWLDGDITLVSDSISLWIIYEIWQFTNMNRLADMLQRWGIPKPTTGMPARKLRFRSEKRTTKLYAKKKNTGKHKHFFKFQILLGDPGFRHKTPPQNKALSLRGVCCGGGGGGRLISHYPPAKYLCFIAVFIEVLPVI